MAADHAPKPNAFLHPDNPDAVFPQIKKPNIIDLRLHMIKNGGLAASGVFRKHLNKNTKQSPYSIVNQPIEEMQTKAKQMPESDSDDEPVAKPQKKITVDDLTAMTAGLKIGKKRPKIDQDIEMNAVSQNSKGISKPKKKACKRLKKQLRF